MPRLEHVNAKSYLQFTGATLLAGIPRRISLGEDALGEDALGEDALGEDALGEDALGEDALGEMAKVHARLAPNPAP